MVIYEGVFDCMIQTGLREITGIRESGLEVWVVGEGINER